MFIHFPVGEKMNENSSNLWKRQIGRKKWTSFAKYVSMDTFATKFRDTHTQPAAQHEPPQLQPGHIWSQAAQKANMNLLEVSSGHIWVPAGIMLKMTFLRPFWPYLANFCV